MAYSGMRQKVLGHTRCEVVGRQRILPRSNSKFSGATGEGSPLVQFAAHCDSKSRSWARANSAAMAAALTVFIAHPFSPALEDGAGPAGCALKKPDAVEHRLAKGMPTSCTRGAGFLAKAAGMTGWLASD
jgi:hypothetical protein